jgi:hypothetical protein
VAKQVLHPLWGLNPFDVEYSKMYIFISLNPKEIWCGPFPGQTGNFTVLWCILTTRPAKI